MHIQGSVALVTGTHRGIGRHFVTALIDQGAAKVYATARDSRGLARTSQRFDGLQRGVGEHGVHLGHYWREGTA